MHKQSGTKRGRSNGSKTPAKISLRQNSMHWQDEEISSSEGENDSDNHHDQDLNDEEDIEESAEAKRLRLAKQYLSHMGSSPDSENESEIDEVDSSAMLSSKLKANRMREKGELYEDFQSLFENLNNENLDRCDMSGHKSSITCLALTKDEHHVFSGSKDNSIIQWDIETGMKTELKARWNKECEYQSNRGEILSVAVSHDSRYVASGGRDNIIRIFDSRQKYAEVKELKGHRDAVTSLIFRMDTHTLFSGSLDRCLKHWDVAEMAYVETMFGHQDGVLSVDCWTKEKPLSASTDRSLRLWKVAEETHLVFRGHKGSIDNVQYLTDSSFVSAGQDGSLLLWKDAQKAPVRSVVAAHGFQSVAGTNTTSNHMLNQSVNPNWICSLASIKMSNIVASGSTDGFVRLWSANAEDRQLIPLCKVAAPGCVNALAVSPRLLVAGCGKEHKYGRWWNLKGGLNKLRVIRLTEEMLEDSSDDQQNSSSQEEEDDESGSSSDNQL